LDIEGLILTKDKATFKLKTLLKHNRLGQPLNTITVYAYNKNPVICIVRTLKTYLKHTKEVRKTNTQLLISYVAPHKPIARATLARWTINALTLSGINMDQFGSHSTRGAVASAAHVLGINISAIMKQAGWRDAKSFAKHYNKSIDDPRLMQHTVLNTAGPSHKN